jgi:hypothetical protein
MSRLLSLLVLSTLALPLRAANSTAAAWPEITRDNKPWTRWWWLGSAVDKPNLTRELEAIAANGFGGVEITPIYGAKGYEERFIRFLSPHYVEMLAHVGAEAKRLGLGVDMATGTGWPFGAPWVGPQDIELRVAFDPEGKLAPRPTGFKVKRSAPGGEGPVLNPYSAAAMTRYLEPFTQALAPLPRGTFNRQFHDSFEYQANWATEVPEKFIALHGYDLRDHVAELAGKGDPDTVARIKADYRTTLGALHLEYVRTWVAWAHARGEKTRNQAHGSPGNLLDLYSATDTPETEIFGSIPFPIPLFRRDPAEIGRPGHPPIIHHFAASAAHVMGKPLASSETFTWLREHFHVAPSEMKPELDALLLTGINHVFYHGNAYSPADAPWPGWLFYASTQANTRNPLWSDLKGLNAYIARCQSLLQAGQPDNDLLVYWPIDDLWHNAEGLQIQLTVHATWLENSRCGQLMGELAAKGYSYDLISGAQLEQTRAEKNGELKTPGGSYRTILVPKTDHMPVATLQRLLALANDGATILFLDALPADVPGFSRLAERRAQLKGELGRLRFSAASAAGLRSAQLGRGQIVLGGDVRTLLAQAHVSRETLADTGLGVLRRRLDPGHGYFIANLTGQPFDGWASLGRPARHALRMDPLNGNGGVAALRTHGGASDVYLQLQPGESVLVKTTAAPAVGSNAMARLWRSGGAPVTLTADWRVTFLRGGPDIPTPQTMTELRSWADAPDDAAQRFGGTARYETEFTLPAGPKADDWQLDLGDVRETARVFVNGQEVDLLWSLPFRTNIGAHLRAGKNTLAIEVTNLAANRIRDLDRRKVEWKKFHEINFVNIFYKPFDASEWPLQPSGLLGPVTLTPLKALQP